MLYEVVVTVFQGLALLLVPVHAQGEQGAHVLVVVDVGQHIAQRAATLGHGGLDRGQPALHLVIPDHLPCAVQDLDPGLGVGDHEQQVVLEAAVVLPEIGVGER